MAVKTQRLGIGKLEAIFEVYTDLIEEKAGTVEQALLWILRQDFKEFCVSRFLCVVWVSMCKSHCVA